MKRSYISPFAILAFAAVMTGCGENSWNDKLDGFEEPPVYQKTLTVRYELTDADYSSIAGLSANKALATTDAEKAALSAIGTNKYFASEDEAHKYLPAFFANSSFPYFTANNGSSISVVYKLGSIPNETVDAINANTKIVSVSEEDYMNLIWESEEDYIPAFSPAKPANADNLAKVLRAQLPDATSGTYALVDYNLAETNPVFGGETEKFEMSSVVGSLQSGDVADVYGVVTGISTRGFVLTDNTGSICYDKAGLSDDALEIGSQVHAQGTVSVYSRCLQIAKNNSYEIVGKQKYEYPTPTFYNANMITEACDASGNMLAQYAEIEGKIQLSGNYVNVIIDGTEKQGSVYNAPDYVKAMLNDGETMKLTGYFIAVTSKGKYFNLLVTAVNGVPAKKSAPAKAPLAAVPSSSKSALMYYNGSEWSFPGNVVVLQPEDYTAMGQSHANLSGTLPVELLPTYMANNYPYANEDDEMIVAYKYYANRVTSVQATQLVYGEQGWAVNNKVVDQFNKLQGEWQFDPSVKLSLLTKGSAECKLFYQTCVDWVYQNIDVPLGSTDIKSGVGYVTSYGNNEYYCGTSAYQSNIDLRPSAAISQYAKGYEGMSDDEVVELEKKRFCYEVCPGALSILYPDAKAVEGIDVLYTIDFNVYTGSTTAYQGVWKVVGPAKFEFVSCTWWDNGVPAN